jgi:hypothetical protein
VAEELVRSLKELEVVWAVYFSLKDLLWVTQVLVSAVEEGNNHVEEVLEELNLVAEVAEHVFVPFHHFDSRKKLAH